MMVPFTKWLSLLLWIGLILWIASRPKHVFFPSDMKMFLGMQREWLQYPYHVGAFFVLAVLFCRCISVPNSRFIGWRTAVVSLVGCFLVSLCSEAIQFYVPNRTPAIRDLAFDQYGALLGITVMRHFAKSANV
jgi:VanZ family protein